MSIISSIGTISPPSGPVVGLPKSFQSDQRQLHPGIGVSVLVLNVDDVKEVIDGVAEDVFVIGVVDMLAIMEEFWTVDVLVRGVVIPVENLDEGVSVDNVVGVVGKLLPVGEPCTVRDVICCEILLVEETEGVAVIFVEVFSVIVDKLLLVEEVMLVDEVVDAVGMLVKIFGKAVSV